MQKIIHRHGKYNVQECSQWLWPHLQNVLNFVIGSTGTYLKPFMCVSHCSFFGHSIVFISGMEQIDYGHAVVFDRVVPESLSNGKVKHVITSFSLLVEYIFRFCAGNSHLGSTGALHCTTLLFLFLDFFAPRIFQRSFACSCSEIAIALGKEQEMHL